MFPTDHLRSSSIYTIPFTTGASNTLPVPQYTFTSPSPDAAEPTNVFPERSTVNSRLPLHAIAILPSTFSTSLSRLISTNSSFGQGDSRHRIPRPIIPRLNSPSFPATAIRKLRMWIGGVY